MTRNTRLALRSAAELALRYWPNAGGDETPRQNLGRAFRFVRTRLQAGYEIQSAIGALEADAYRHADM